MSGETWEYEATWRLVEALEERNVIEKAKLAEMRAARHTKFILDLTTLEPPKAVEHNHEADRLTAEVLEEETTNDT